MVAATTKSFRMSMRRVIGAIPNLHDEDIVHGGFIGPIKYRNACARRPRLQCRTLASLQSPILAPRRKQIQVSRRHRRPDLKPSLV